jgi:hypothetical protein
VKAKSIGADETDKLREPADNPRAAFCCIGCFRSSIHAVKIMRELAEDIPEASRKLRMLLEGMKAADA